MRSKIAYISLAIAVASAATVKQEDMDVPCVRVLFCPTLHNGVEFQSISFSLTGAYGKAQTIRYLHAYTDYDTQGPYINFFDYSPDLSLAGVNDALKSGCFTGLWIVYDGENYGPEGGLSCSAVGISGCVPAFGNCTGVISSLRYAGNPDGLNADYYNLYAGSYFTGDEFRHNDSAITVGDLNERVSSLIISGTAQWTFFTLPQFGGASVCVTPDLQLTDSAGTVLNYNYVYEVTDLGLPDNSIRSVVKGCLPHARVVGSSRRVVPNHSVGQAPAVQQGY